MSIFLAFLIIIIQCNQTQVSNELLKDGSMSQRSDHKDKWSKLMYEAQKGNKQSYNQLLREISKVISAFIRTRIKDKDMAEDITQEVLISIHKARHTYDSDRTFSSWMFAIAKYKLIDHLRKAQRTTKNEVSDDGFIDNMVTLESDDGMELLREELHLAIEKLPEKQRNAVKLLKLEGHSIKEVAETTGMTESAVKVTAHRAYKALRKKLVGVGL